MIHTTIAHYHLTHGDTSVLTDLEVVARLTRHEQGSLYFHIVRDVKDPLHIILVEGWNSTEALERHQREPHFVTGLLQRIVPRLRSRTVTVAVPALGPDFH